MRVSSFYVQLFTQKAFSPVEVSLHLKEIAKRGSSHPEVFGCKKGALENFTWNSQEIEIHRKTPKLCKILLDLQGNLGDEVILLAKL